MGTPDARDEQLRGVLTCCLRIRRLSSIETSTLRRSNGVGSFGAWPRSRRCRRRFGQSGREVSGRVAVVIRRPWRGDGGNGSARYDPVSSLIWIVVTFRLEDLIGALVIARRQSQI